MTDTQAPEKVIINGQEYSPEEATQFIELGNKYKDLESKLNTSLDKVYPEFTKTSQRNKELEESLRQRDEESSAFKKAQEEAKIKANTPDEVTKAREAARSLGLADENFLKENNFLSSLPNSSLFCIIEKYLLLFYILILIMVFLTLMFIVVFVHHIIFEILYYINIIKKNGNWSL